MRVAIILCFIVAANAGSIGYNYQPVGQSGNGGGLSFGPADSGASTDDSPAYASFPVAPSLSAAPSSGSPSYSAPESEFQKDFFTYVANDDEFDDPAASDQVANSLKKNLRVVFIKGPEGRGLENAVLNLAKQAADQKTAIYVLQKHTDLGDLANKLNAAHDVSRSKPEVHFVKYRTPEDAANAQRAIQSQYDQLGGNSQSHDGGVAPVHNFASHAPAPQRQPVSGPGPAYLPSSIIRL